MVLIEAPVEAAPRPLLASAFWREFAAAAFASWLAVEALDAPVGLTLPPLGEAPPLDEPPLRAAPPDPPAKEAPPLVADGDPPELAVPLAEELPMVKALVAAAVLWVPLSVPPEVLTQMSLRVSGSCQNSGATSIMT